MQWRGGWDSNAMGSRPLLALTELRRAGLFLPSSLFRLPATALSAPGAGAVQLQGCIVFPSPARSS